MTTPPLRIAIIDDEPPAIRLLEVLLTRLGDVEIVGTADNGEAGIALLTDVAADVVLLDIEMPVASGFDLIEALPPDRLPAVVFVTAFSNYATRAFDVRAIDYVLKPVRAERLAEAIARARDSQRLRAADARAADLRQAILEVRHDIEPDAPTAYESQLWIQRRGRYERLAVDDIDWIEAERDYVRLHFGTDNALYSETMNGMETRLDPARFTRVHRSAIVRRDRVNAFRRSRDGGVVLHLSNGATVPVGRSYAARAREILALG